MGLGGDGKVSLLNWQLYCISLGWYYNHSNPESGNNDDKDNDKYIREECQATGECFNLRDHVL